MSTRNTDPLSATFAALADPTRRAILARLAEGETSIKAIAEPFAMTAPAVTKHLKVLERAGLISRGREAQWRPAKLQAEPLREANAWMEQYRRHWEARLDRLDDYLNELQEQMRAPDVELDSDGLPKPTPTPKPAAASASLATDPRPPAPRRRLPGLRGARPRATPTSPGEPGASDESTS